MLGQVPWDSELLVNLLHPVKELQYAQQIGMTPVQQRQPWMKVDHFEEILKGGSITVDVKETITALEELSLNSKESHVEEDVMILD